MLERKPVKQNRQQAWSSCLGCTQNLVSQPVLCMPTQYLIILRYGNPIILVSYYQELETEQIVKTYQECF